MDDAKLKVSAERAKRATPALATETTNQFIE
jgi:hypothetical protein